jgi:hypothetical protein
MQRKGVTDRFDQMKRKSNNLQLGELMKLEMFKLATLMLALTGDGTLYRACSALFSAISTSTQVC